MKTKGILILSTFTLILLIPTSSSTPNQNSTPDMTIMTSNQTSDFTQTHSGDTQKNTFQTSTSTLGFLNILQTTQALKTKTKVSDTSSTSPPNTKNPNPKIWIVSILLVIIVVMVIVGCVHHFYNKESDQDSSVTRFLLDVRESLRTLIRNLQDQLGVVLWLGDRRGVENAMEEAEGRQLEEGEEWKSDGQSSNSEVSDKEKEKLIEEDSDTSDDCSSMDGDNLRERALNKQNEEDKDGDEMNSSSDEGQTEGQKEISGRNKNEYSEETALVKSPQKYDEKADLCDVTAL